MYALCAPGTVSMRHVFVCHIVVLHIIINVHSFSQKLFRTQELCECRGGRLKLSVPKSLYGLCGRKATLYLTKKEFRSCVKVEVDVLGSPSLIVFMISVDVKQHCT